MSLNLPLLRYYIFYYITPDDSEIWNKLLLQNTREDIAQDPPRHKYILQGPPEPQEHSVRRAGALRQTASLSRAYEQMRRRLAQVSPQMQRLTSTLALRIRVLAERSPAARMI